MLRVAAPCSQRPAVEASPMVSADGTLLHDAGAVSRLPTLVLRTAPGGTRLTDSDSQQLIALLAAAPYQLLSRLGQASASAQHGLAVQVRNGMGK